MISGTYNLSGLWPPFAEAVRYFLAWCDYLGLQGQITSGYRSTAEQWSLYRRGRTPAQLAAHTSLHGANGSVTDALPGQSAHNYGLAIDIEGRDQKAITTLAGQLGFGLVSWDPAHVEWPGWRSLLG